MTREEIKALVEKLVARKAEIDAMPLEVGGLLGKRASKQAVDAYANDVQPGMMALYEDLKNRGMIDDLNDAAVIEKARVIADGGYWVEAAFSADDDMLFFPVGSGFSPITQAEAVKDGHRRWVAVQ